VGTDSVEGMDKAAATATLKKHTERPLQLTVRP
jgi:hypothetical protein